MKKIIMATIATSLMIGATGCTGPFLATQKIHKWQQGLFQSGSQRNKLVEEITFLGCCILPVYGLAVLCDAVVFNSCEFWGESNPVASTKTIEQDGVVAEVTYNVDGTITIANAKGESFTLIKDGDTVIAKNAQGEVIH